MRNTIQIVNPSVDRGRPPRDLTLRDIITVPVNYGRGSWGLLDLIAGKADSIAALWTMHTRAEVAATQRTAAKRAPARRRKAANTDDGLPYQGQRR